MPKPGVRSELVFAYKLVILEKQRDAPDRRRSDKCVNYPAEHRAHTAEKESDQIKLEYADKSPVDAADYQQRQKYLVPH